MPDFHRFFWWTEDPNTINLDENKRDIILQIVNYGGWRHWQWLVDRYGREGVKQVILEIPESAFMPRVLKLIKLLFGIKKLRYASRSDYIRAKTNF
jgi:hypothetical protein